MPDFTRAGGIINLQDHGGGRQTPFRNQHRHRRATRRAEDSAPSCSAWPRSRATRTAACHAHSRKYAAQAENHGTDSWHRSALVLLLSSTIFVGSQVIAYKRLMVSELNAVTGVIASNVSAAVVFDDTACGGGDAASPRRQAGFRLGAHPAPRRQPVRRPRGAPRRRGAETAGPGWPAVDNGGWRNRQPFTAAPCGCSTA